MVKSSVQHEHAAAMQYEHDHAGQCVGQQLLAFLLGYTLQLGALRVADAYCRQT